MTSRLFYKNGTDTIEHGDPTRVYTYVNGLVNILGTFRVVFSKESEKPSLNAAFDIQEVGTSNKRTLLFVAEKTITLDNLQTKTYTNDAGVTFYFEKISIPVYKTNGKELMTGDNVLVKEYKYSADVKASDATGNIITSGIIRKTLDGGGIMKESTQIVINEKPDSFAIVDTEGGVNMVFTSRGSEFYSVDNKNIYYTMCKNVTENSTCVKSVVFVEVPATMYYRTMTFIKQYKYFFLILLLFLIYIMVKVFPYWFMYKKMKDVTDGITKGFGEKLIKKN